jgi:hypothetical protein
MLRGRDGEYVIKDISVFDVQEKTRETVIFAAPYTIKNNVYMYTPLGCVVHGSIFDAKVNVLFEAHTSVTQTCSNLLKIATHPFTPPVRNHRTYFF